MPATTGVKQVVTKRVEPAIQTEHPQKVYNTKKTIFRMYQIIWYVLAIIEIFLAFRMVFKAVGANPYSGFASFIYALSNPLAVPFQGIVANSVYGNSVFEWSTIIAAVVFFLIAWGLVYLFQMMKPVTPQEVEGSVDNP